MTDEYVSEKERALIEQAIAGDGRAFTALMRPYLPRVKRKVRSYFRREEDAEDALQELQFAIFRRLHTFKHQSKFGTWVFRCTVNGALEHLQRRVIPHEHVSLDVAFGAKKLDTTDESGPMFECTLQNMPAIGDANNPEAQLEAKQKLQALDAALDSLPPAFKQAFWLREIDQLSYEEIAAEMGCCDGTVKSRINRARQVIYAVLVD